MKKIMVLFVVFIILAGYIFAQNSQQANYIVKTVTGRVQREAGNSRVDVKAGDTLPPLTVVYTGIGASLVLTQGEATFTIPANRNGKVGELAAAGAGVRINENVARVETGVTARTGGQISTASARASDAAADDNIAEE